MAVQLACLRQYLGDVLGRFRIRVEGLELAQHAVTFKANRLGVRTEIRTAENSRRPSRHIVALQSLEK
jgi:hypothetical protein